jgi:hypothetical protein
MNFKNLTYAKLNLDFDKDLFSKEYDEQILPNGVLTGNGYRSVHATTFLNKVWGMVPPEEYHKVNGMNIQQLREYIRTWSWLK